MEQKLCDNFELVITLHSYWVSWEIATGVPWMREERHTEDMGMEYMYYSVVSKQFMHRLHI